MYLKQYTKNIRTRKYEGKTEIYDIIRKKYVMLTPEEWVRQHMILYLVEGLQYPKSLCKVESSLKYNRLYKRSDLLIYDNTMQPLILVECKSFKVKLSQKAIEQVTVYNKQIGAAYWALTNGKQTVCFRFNKEAQVNEPIDCLPNYRPG